MLSVLHIENIAVIQSADISFSSGFNVLTGETGAGKSIVIDAIGAVIGERTSRDLIRTGAKSAYVSAVFCSLPSLAWLRESGITPDENGELLIERQIQPDGKNICRVAGRLVTVSQLKALGQQLVNIHGQHDGQQLLDEDSHLEYLDRFGCTSQEMAAFSDEYSKMIGIKRELSNLRMDAGEKARRIDTLSYQIKELERAELREGEEEELLARRDLLRNAEKLMDALERSMLALNGDDQSDGICGLSSDVCHSLGVISGISKEMEELADAAESMRAAAEDLTECVRSLRDEFDFSPGELDEIEGRLDLLYRLKRKYGSTVEEMLAYLERCRNELDTIEFSDEKALKLEKELETSRAITKRKAEILSDSRKLSAEKLSDRIQNELAQLDMPKIRFQVEFSEKNAEDGMDATGMDEIRFLMSANVGEDLKPINKIASGGELARIMLALKNVLAETDDVSTLVFDEVDTGVSGRAAQKVAEKLFSVARSKQVLCVTHLPQIAAMGDVHFSVEKGESGGRTFTAVESLSPERRCEELARLTGGSDITATMLKSAGELLSAAGSFKNACLTSKQSL